MNILFSVIQYEDINFNIIPMLIIDNIRNNLCNSELNNIHLQVELLEISEKYFNFNHIFNIIRNLFTKSYRCLGEIIYG